MPETVENTYIWASLQPMLARKITEFAAPTSNAAGSQNVVPPTQEVPALETATAAAGPATPSAAAGPATPSAEARSATPPVPKEAPEEAAPDAPDNATAPDAPEEAKAPDAAHGDAPAVAQAKQNTKVAVTAKSEVVAANPGGDAGKDSAAVAVKAAPAVPTKAQPTTSVTGPSPAPASVNNAVPSALVAVAKAGSVSASSTTTGDTDESAQGRTKRARTVAPPEKAKAKPS